jgi:hypothetical protein
VGSNQDERMAKVADRIGKRKRAFGILTLLLHVCYLKRNGLEYGARIISEKVLL